ncbi:serine/threonine-protein kinase [Actinoplanes palleronii]|uniref:non-specific serine/threonine protein kinase n=1 Tax=Actinoplanes palleronii TaxID=113570 RepID=A0ABQ4BBU7_9ACTN|nr:serine/threonine-protein kinase [Actinoplanes palleronii]GIE68173.1 hypothetical protein Apa02nite_042810 [Actinoplanes palleronii]
MPHRTGELLGARYRLDDRIAAGGMGEVWDATDTVLNRAVAVKTLHADRAVDPQFQSRFQHEARAMAALHDPGIADVYDFGGGRGDEAYLVMARVQGEPLDRRIAARGRLGPAETMSIVAQVARALQAAHDAGIVHRDVKPANLIIASDGTVVLVDFGVAQSARSAALTGVNEVVGTAVYISPEQVAKRSVGPAADLYALGVVAYHCLAGHPPFLGDNPVAIAMQHLEDDPPPLPAEVPAPVRDVVSTAMAKDPAARFPSATAMAVAADHAVRAAPATTAATTVRIDSLRTGRTSPPVEPPAERSRRRSVLIALLTAVLVVLGVGGALALADPFGWFPASTPRPSTSISTTPSAPVSTAPGGGGGPAPGHPSTHPSAPASSPSPPSPSPSSSSGSSPSPSASAEPSSAGPSPSTRPSTTTPTSEPPASPRASASS